MANRSEPQCHTHTSRVYTDRKDFVRAVRVTDATVAGRGDDDSDARRPAVLEKQNGGKQNKKKRRTKKKEEKHRCVSPTRTRP